MRYSPTSVSCGRQHFYCTMLGKHINHWLLPSLSQLQHYCPGPGNRGKMVVVLGVACRRLMSRDKRDCSEGSLLHHVGFCFFSYCNYLQSKNWAGPNKFSPLLPATVTGKGGAEEQDCEYTTTRQKVWSHSLFQFYFFSHQ